MTLRRAQPATAALLALAAAAILPACRGERTQSPPRQFIPDMDDSPKMRNQTRTAFFPDGRMMRPRVAGTVAFGDDTDHAAPARADYLREDPLVFDGFDPAKPKSAEGDPAYAPFMPKQVLDHWIAQANTRGFSFNADNAASRSEAMVAMTRRGQERFNIYCSACHGYEGDGQGLVGLRWGAPVPTFHDPKYKDRSLKTGMDGYIFHTIRHGVPAADPVKDPPKMPAYADKISVADAWAIVAYIRALQNARTDQPAKAADAAPADAGAQATLSMEVTK